MRQLRNGETMCKFGCNTIATNAIPSCEMCCDVAIAERHERLAPIKEAELKAAEEKAARLLELKAKALEAKEEFELERATAPLSEDKPKRGRGRS